MLFYYGYPARISTPNLTPYRYGFNNPLRYKDPNGKWEEDGHYWTIFALGISMGFDMKTAQYIAAQSEHYDHHVSASGNFSFNGLGFTWNNDDGTINDRFGLIGTWGIRGLQEKYHGLTNGSQYEVWRNSRNKIILDGDLKGLHTLGDAFAHSLPADAEKMFGVKRSVVFNGKIYYFPITLAHAIDDEHGGDITDDISNHRAAYLAYVNATISVFQDELFKYSYKADSSPDLELFQYVATSGASKNDNIYLFKRYIEYKGDGQTSFIYDLSDKNQYEGFIEYLKVKKIDFKITTTETVYGRNGAKKIKKIQTLEVSKGGKKEGKILSPRDL